MWPLIIKLLDEHKNNVAVATVFFVAGFSAHSWMQSIESQKLNAETVIKNSYVLKGDLEKDYVLKSEYLKIAQDLRDSKSENDSIKLQQNAVNSSQLNYKNSVCNRFASEANRIMGQLDKIESDIEQLSSPHRYGEYKNVIQLDSDRKQIEQLRQSSLLFNQQLNVVRTQLGQCVK